MLVDLHVFEDGLYRPPVLRYPSMLLKPPQMIISVPVHTDRCANRRVGTLAPVAVATHVSAVGS